MDRLPPTSGLGRVADTASRSVRISGLPELTPEQEPLLQQALEKLVKKVVMLTVSNETHDAVVELETQAVSTFKVSPDIVKLTFTSRKRQNLFS